MTDQKLADLERLVAKMRALGVAHFSDAELTVTLGPEPPTLELFERAAEEPEKTDETDLDRVERLMGLD